MVFSYTFIIINNPQVKRYMCRLYCLSIILTSLKNNKCNIYVDLVLLKLSKLSFSFYNKKFSTKKKENLNCVFTIFFIIILKVILSIYLLNRFLVNVFGKYFVTSLIY